MRARHRPRNPELEAALEHATCEGCGNAAPHHHLIHDGSHDGGYRLLCTACFNANAAARAGLAHFEHVQLEPVALSDSEGAVHQFHFRVRFLGNLLSVDAFELDGSVPAGYQFQQLGDPGEELLVIVGRLIQKIRRTLAVKHITNGRLGPAIIDRCVRGYIEYDDQADGRLPLVVVDGRPMAWDELGAMLITFEGWQFKLELFDRSEEP